VTPRPAKTTPGEWLRVHLTYFWRHRRVLNLRSPTRFTELVQRRKLSERDPRLPRLIDKLGAKRFVIDQLGAEWVTPTLWSGPVLPKARCWSPPFVVKSRHGCNQHRFIRTGAEDWRAIRRAAARWMRRDYGFWLDEHGYRGIPHGLLVEPFVGDGTTLPIDYKFYVFHGKVAFIQVHLGREDNHRWLIFDRDWRRVSHSPDQTPDCPATLGRMIAAAETLGTGFDFVRVDLYEVSGQPRFGEMTFYPGSGLDPFDPPELDTMMGALWLAGRPERPGDYKFPTLDLQHQRNESVTSRR
jgi:hypothetical protein